MQNEEMKPKRQRASLNKKLRVLIERLGSETDNGLTQERAYSRLCCIINPVQRIAYEVANIQIESFKVEDVIKKPQDFLNYFLKFVKQINEWNDKIKGVRVFKQPDQVRQHFVRFDRNFTTPTEPSPSAQDRLDREVLDNVPSPVRNYHTELASYRSIIATTEQQLQDPLLSDDRRRLLTLQLASLQRGMAELQANHTIIGNSDDNPLETERPIQLTTRPRRRSNNPFPFPSRPTEEGQDAPSQPTA